MRCYEVTKWGTSRTAVWWSKFDWWEIVGQPQCRVLKRWEYPLKYALWDILSYISSAFFLSLIVSAYEQVVLLMGVISCVKETFCGTTSNPVKNLASKSEFLLSWPSLRKPEANIGPHSMHTMTNISRGSYVLASHLVSIIRDLNLLSKLAHAWMDLP
jgi:hypothetical protein